MNLIQAFGRKVPNAALAPKGAVFGGAYEDFVARMNGQVNAAVPSQKVAIAIPRTTVLKSATTVIELQPQVDFKGERLVLSQSGGTLFGASGNFTVNSVKVGRKEQLVSPTPVVGNVFGDQSQRVIGLNMETCPTSLKIYIEVTNLDSKAVSQVISGMLVGSCGGCNENACGVSDPAGSATYEPLVPIGIPITTVKAGSAAIIEVTPQVFFTGQQLVVPTSLWDKTSGALIDPTQYFEIASVKVGREEQLVSPDALAAAVFADNSQQQIGLSMKGCPTSLKIYIEVINLDGADRDFGGTIYGFCGENGNCNTGLCGIDFGVAAMTPGLRPIVNQTTLAAAMPNGLVGGLR